MNPWMALADVRSQLMIDEHNKYPEQLFNCSVSILGWVVVRWWLYIFRLTFDPGGSYRVAWHWETRIKEASDYQQ